MGVLSIIQTQANGHNATDGTTTQVHFGVAPTSGNLLVAVGMMYSGNGAPSAASGWTIDTSSLGASTTMYTVVYYKYAGGGESTTQQPDATGRNYWGLTVWEINGVSGTWATDRIATHLNADAQIYPSTGPYSTGSFNTANNNELLLGGFTGNSGAGNLTLTSGSYTQDATFTESGGNLCGSLAIHTAVPGSGTAITTSISSGVASNGEYAWIELQSASPASTETATVVMGLSKVSFNAGAGRAETATSSFGLTKVSFSSNARRIHVAAQVLMALQGVSIVAGTINFGVPGTGGISFSTFGS